MLSKILVSLVTVSLLPFSHVTAVTTSDNSSVNVSPSETLEPLEVQVDFEVDSSSEEMNEEVGEVTVEFEEPYLIPQVDADYDNTTCTIKIPNWSHEQDIQLLECNGEFGLIDAGEDSGYADTSIPRYAHQWVDRSYSTNQGTESLTIDWMKREGVTSDNLKFFIGTHAHSDHIGGAPYVIKEFTPDVVYSPYYSNDIINPANKPGALWDNQWVYDKMVEAANTHSHLVTYIDPAMPANTWNGDTGSNKLTLGGMNLEIFNYEPGNNHVIVADHNEYSYGIKVTMYGHSAWLAGDINNFPATMSEDKLGPLVGEVDVMKAGHHGYAGSNTLPYLDHLNPKVFIVTGNSARLPSETVTWLQNHNTPIATPGFAKNAGLEAISIFFTSEEIKYDMAVSKPIEIIKNGWFQKGADWYYGENGYIKVQWLATGGKWYYLDPEMSGRMVSNTIKTINGKEYIFDTSGAMRTGWVYQNGSWYWAEASGALASGWKYINNRWYFFEWAPDHKMATGIINTGGKYYNLGKYGAMGTGWQYVDGTWYWGDSSGALATGWRYINGKWYMFDSSAKMLSNTKSGNYFLTSSGVMAANQWVYDGKQKAWYWATGSGAFGKGWLYYNRGWYWLDPNNGGKMAANDYYVTGSYISRFSGSGLWLGDGVADVGAGSSA
ncbi:MAG: MBL fold metallo-hydrolase [Arcanobacterium sp.]